MNLAAGTKLGPYEIVAPLGAGGMGEVYRARDTKLNRDVAIKVLPEMFAADADRVARLTREAQVLASLNHPNIAQIYGIEGNALVMELVEGQDLSELIGSAGPKGPALQPSNTRTSGAPDLQVRRIELSDAIAIAKQIADALEAAHEQGIVHRDLKPANIKVRADGTVKVLDFGLAKAMSAEGSSAAAEAMNSPTMTARATQMGMIIGTAAYMSPEQAKGRAVDKRADIWAFGVVLYEMLTGRRAFDGDDITEVLASVLKTEPDWSAVPADLPASIRRLLRRCLEKDPRARLSSIGDARLELYETEPAAAPHAVVAATAPPSLVARLTPWVAGIVAGAVAGIGLWSTIGPGANRASGSGGPVRLSISIPSSIHAQFAGIHGDGETVLVAGFPRRSDGSNEPRARIWARRLDSYEFTPIPGTDGIVDYEATRDGKWLSVVSLVSDQSSQRRIAKVPVDGSSPPITIADWDDDWGSFVWLEDGDLLITSNRQTKFFRLPTNGGAAKAAIAFDTGDVKGRPTFGASLPGDRGVFFGMETWGPRGYQLDQWLLDTKTGKATRILENAGSAEYVSTGHVVFTRGTVMLAAPFSLDTLAVTGDVVALPGTVRVANSWANGEFQVSANGTLLAAAGGRLGTNRRLVIADSAGQVTSFGSDRRAFETPPRVSADGGKVAVIIANSKGTFETWLAELNRANVRRLLMLPNADCADPIWSSDGARVGYMRTARDKDDGIYVQRLDGSGSPLAIVKRESLEVDLSPTSWAPGGDGLAFTKVVGGKADIMFAPIPADGNLSTPRALRATSNSERDAHFSPDGRLVAFVSDESGRGEVYVARYAGGSLGPAVVVSNGGAEQPMWAKDSRRLFFNDETDKVFSVTVSATPAVTASTPVLAYDLKKLRVNRLEWDILPDGRLLAIQKGEDEDDVLAYNVVLNWFEELRAKAPVRK